MLNIGHRSLFDKRVFCLYGMLLIAIYYAVPKSFVFSVSGDFRLFSLYLQPWFFQRYILLALCMLFSIFYVLKFGFFKKYEFVLIFLLFLMVGFVSYLEEGPVFLYAIFGVLSSYVIYKCFGDFYVSSKVFKYIILGMILCYVAQYFFYRAANRVVSSFLDPNISGYYLFLGYCLLRAWGYRLLSLIVCFIGVVSLSRNFLLAVLVFEFIQSGFYDRITSRIVFNKSPFFLFLISFIAVLTFSYVMVGVGDVNKVIGGDADRMTNIVDGSNYARAKANVSIIERMLEGEFMLHGNGTEADIDTEHRPHNAFFRAIYRYGLVLTVLVFYISLISMKVVSQRNFPMLAGVFCYYSILGDFVTGPELSLLLFVAILSSSYSKTKKRYKFILS